MGWSDPASLASHGDREAVAPWSWTGPVREVTGRTWGGCIEVLRWILAAGGLGFDPVALDGGVLLIEASESLTPATGFGQILSALGDLGIVGAVDAVLVARPPTTSQTVRRSASERASLRVAQRDVATEVIGRYNPGAVVNVGVPFGHTRPQWILPYGGQVTIDAVRRRIWASYD